MKWNETKRNELKWKIYKQVTYVFFHWLEWKIPKRENKNKTSPKKKKTIFVVLYFIFFCLHAKVSFHRSKNKNKNTFQQKNKKIKWKKNIFTCENLWKKNKKLSRTCENLWTKKEILRSNFSSTKRNLRASAAGGKYKNFVYCVCYYCVCYYCVCYYCVCYYCLLLLLLLYCCRTNHHFSLGVEFSTFFFSFDSATYEQLRVVLKTGSFCKIFWKTGKEYEYFTHFMHISFPCSLESLKWARAIRAPLGINRRV